MASLAGFADAKRPERNTPTPAPKASPLGGTTGATPSPQLAGFAPAAKPLNGFAPAKPAAASGFAPAKPVATGFAAAKPVRARTGAAAIPPGRDGGVVPRGPRLSDKWVSACSAPVASHRQSQQAMP